MKKILIQVFTIVASVSAYAQPALENLGAKVNSIYSEVRPTISADGKIIYYVVEGNPKNNNFKKDKIAQDIWFSELDEAGNWGTAAQSTLNGVIDNAVFWVSPDGNRLMIRGAYDNGKYIGRGLSFCNKVKGGWSAPQKLKIKGYSQMSVDKYSGATMSNDGKTLLLYFSEEKNSFLNDIYFSRLNETTEEWSTPVKLGGNINMDDYDEISPFLASDGVTMYFASNRPGGLGDYDIYMAKRLDLSLIHI
jgi:OOP family OmpA-OmpF porin